MIKFTTVGTFDQKGLEICFSPSFYTTIKRKQGNPDARNAGKKGEGRNFRAQGESATLFFGGPAHLATDSFLAAMTDLRTSLRRKDIMRSDVRPPVSLASGGT